VLTGLFQQQTIVIPSYATQRTPSFSYFISKTTISVAINNENKKMLNSIKYFDIYVTI